MIAVRKILKKRGIDDWGDGAFGAPRGTYKSGSKKGQKKTHKGEDLETIVDEEVFSPVKGSVTKLGYPYTPKPGEKTTFRYVEVTDYKGNRHRVFYIDPSVGMEQHVDTTTVIGLAQDISGKFHNPKKRPMINHLHYEIFDANGDLLNPEEFI